MTSKPTNPFKAVFVPELIARVPPRWLVKNLIRERQFGVLHAPKSSGKTLVALALGLSIAMGQPFFGLKARQGFVAYACGEGGDSIGKRVHAVLRRDGSCGDIPAAPDFCVFELVPNLSDPTSVAQFIEGVREAAGGGRIALVVIDTLSRATAGVNENDAGEIGFVVEAIATIQRELACGVLLLHHDKKNEPGVERGSSVLGAAADVMISVERLRGEKFVIRLCVTKTKDDAEPPPMDFELVLADLGPSRDPDAEGGERETSLYLKAMAEPARAVRSPGVRNDNEQRIVDLLNGIGPGHDLTPTQVVEELQGPGFKRAAIYAMLADLAHRELIKVQRRGQRTFYSMRSGATC